jgi:hypothetical protein
MEECLSQEQCQQVILIGATRKDLLDDLDINDGLIGFYVD